MNVQQLASRRVAWGNNPDATAEERSWVAHWFTHMPPHTKQWRMSYWGKMNWCVRQALLRKVSSRGCGVLLALLEYHNTGHRNWVFLSKLCCPNWMYRRPSFKTEENIAKAYEVLQG
jgi:hypothetical protein